MATIAVNTYDLGKVAANLAERADYAGLTAILSAELTADRIGEHATGKPAAPAPVDGDDLADDDAPVSGGAPVNLATVSKTAAIHYAHTALGEVPASRVVDYLATAGVRVSESLVYKARRQVPAPVAELPAPSTPPALPAAPAAPEPTPAPLALVEPIAEPTPARPRRPRTTRTARPTATPAEVTPDTTEQPTPAASSAPRRPARRPRATTPAAPVELSDPTPILTPVNGTRPDLATPATN
jgi:hypothetical protein